MSNRELFAKTYTEALAECVQNPKHEYHWPVSDVPRVAAKMLTGLDTNGTNINDSPAFKLACKRLGIKCTYKAIREFRNATQAEPVAHIEGNWKAVSHVTGAVIASAPTMDNCSAAALKASGYDQAPGTVVPYYLTK